MIERTADVLIIGTGIAGLRAALASASLGRSVALVSRSDVGNSTKSPANIRYRQDFILIKDAGDRMGDDTLIDLLCRRSESEVDHVRDKTDMIETEFGYMPAGGGGRQVMASIRSELRNLDVDELSGLRLVDLMVKDDRCHGAVFVGTGGDPVSFLAGSTVLATGGYSNAVGASDNPHTVDGVGISAAFRRGAALLNPEFVMSHPFGVRYTKNIIAGKPLEYPAVVDESGRRILPESLEECVRNNDYHHRLAELSSIFAGMVSGGGRVFLDYGSVREDRMLDLANKTTYGRSLSLLKDGRLEINPIYHYSIGGLKIDKNGQTTVEGLYAAGEIVGGLHGSSRLGGNAVAESLVFGGIAGEAAASTSRVRHVRCETSPVQPPKADVRMVKDAGYLSDAIGAEDDVFVKSILVSSLEREESVGYFMRSDFPERAGRSRNHHVHLKGRTVYVD